MGRLCFVLAFLALGSTPAIAGDQSPRLKRGELIGKYLQELKKYGSGQALPESSASPARTEATMWQIGDGYLVIETTSGAGIVKDVTYVIGAQKEKKIALKVKEVDLIKGEMTIALPNGSAPSAPAE